jgi:hypothetical protein
MCRYPSLLRRSACLIALIAFAQFCGRAAGQALPSSAAVNTSSQPIPLHHRYGYFLKYQISLDKKADLLDEQGDHEKAAMIRGHVQQDLHFTDDQIAIVRKAGLRLTQDLESIRVQEMPIISADRQWGKLHGRKAGPPPGAYAIHGLQKEHEAMLLSMVDKLNQQLGPEGAARLQTYVSVHVTGQRTAIPSRKPKLGTPFHVEAR